MTEKAKVTPEVRQQILDEMARMLDDEIEIAEQAEAESNVVKPTYGFSWHTMQ